MSKKKIRKAKSKKAYKVRLKPSTVLSIVQIVFYSLAGLIIVSFSRRGLIFVSLGLLVSKLRVPIAQPNVIVGALLFFISIMSLTKAGSLGLAAWDGIATLITGAGAAIVLFGSTVVGLIILFNTSIDQIILFFLQFMKTYTLRGVSNKQRGFKTSGRGEMKVLGGTQNPSQQANTSRMEQTKSF